MAGGLMGRGNHYIQLVKFLYCKLPTIGKKLPTFKHRVWGLNHQPQRWEVSVLPLCHMVALLGWGHPIKISQNKNLCQLCPGEIRA